MHCNWICSSCPLIQHEINVGRCSLHNGLQTDHQDKHMDHKPCFKAPVATTSFGSTHGCDDVLLFALSLSACQSILPIKPTDNFMANPLNAQAAAGRGSIINTGWIESE